MNTSILLGVLAFLTTVLIGLHASWLVAGTVLLSLFWLYAIATLLFKRPRPAPLSFNFVPGDVANLDQLHQRALHYCNEIIDHYQDARYTMRRYYVVAQILIATLSGLTPILVLIDRNKELMATIPESLQFAITWAVLILPGIAAVLATTATIFNFQEEWIQAKKTAEALEALREEFVMGVPPHYEISARDPEERLYQRKQALENFILQVNALHLKQIDQWAQRAIAQSSPIPPRPEPSDEPMRAEIPPSTPALPDVVVEDASVSDESIPPRSHKRLTSQARPEQSGQLTLSPPQDAVATQSSNLEDNGPFLT